MDYRAKATEVAATLQHYLESDKWEIAKETKDYKISCVKSEHFSGHLYKGEAEYNAPPKTVFEYVEPLPDGPRSKWDKNMKKIETVKWLSDDLRINRACTASACMGLISPRDFVDLILTKETDKYFSTNAISIEPPKDLEIEIPQENGHVRGWNWPCGMIVYKVEDNPNKCKLVSLIQPDIKGMVPKHLTDAAIPGSMVEFFTSLRDALKNDGKMVE